MYSMKRWRQSSQNFLRERSLKNINCSLQEFSSCGETEFWQPVPNWFKDNVLTRAEELRGEAWPLPTASKMVEYRHSGDREGYEALVRQRQSMLTTFALAALISGEDRWIDSVLDGAVALCEQLSWCWPAHDDSFASSGSLLPLRSRPYLDLGASEVVSQLAWICKTLGAPLEEKAAGFRHMVRTEITQRAFLPRLERDDWPWLGITRPANNWLAWIDGNLLGAAMAMFDGTALSKSILETCSEGIGRFLQTVPADGAIDEGFSYWWVGVGKALHALGLFHEATPEIDSHPLVTFPELAWLGSDWFVSYADTVAKPLEPIPWHILMQIAHKIDNAWAYKFGETMQAKNGQIYCPEWGFLSNLQFAANFHHENPKQKPDHTELGGEVVLPSRHIALLREDPATLAGFSAMIKGGNNDESHNHLDLGTITLAHNGTPVLIDVGREMYDRQSFGPNRYDMWYVQSQWHNVVRVCGIDQKPGQKWHTGDFLVVRDPKQPKAELSLDDAYAVEGYRWRRTIALDRELARVTVTESLSGVKDPTIFLVLAGKSSINGDTVEVEPLCGSERIIFKLPEAKIGSETRILEDPLMRHSWGESITRLTVNIPTASNSSTYRWSVAACQKI